MLFLPASWDQQKPLNYLQSLEFHILSKLLKTSLYETVEASSIMIEILLPWFIHFLKSCFLIWADKYFVTNKSINLDCYNKPILILLFFKVLLNILCLTMFNYFLTIQMVFSGCFSFALSILWCIFSEVFIIADVFYMKLIYNLFL